MGRQALVNPVGDGRATLRSPFSLWSLGGEREEEGVGQGVGGSEERGEEQGGREVGGDRHR